VARKKNTQKQSLKKTIPRLEFLISPQHLLFLSLFFLFCFAVYAITTCPTVAEGDSGELIAAVHTMGIIHPPGFPLYAILAKIFSYLVPIGSPAFKINLFSGFCNAAAAVLLFLCILRWTRQVWPAFIVAGLYAFSPLIWSYSVIAEVFGLNNFFIGLLLYLLIKFQQKPESNTAFLMAFVGGLGLSNHHTLIFFVIPIGLWVLFHHKILLRSKNFLILLGLFFLGFSPYLYMPFAAAKIPMISWGRVQNFSGVWDHFLRKDFGTFQLSNTYLGKDSQFFKAVFYYAINILQQTLFIGFFLAAFGILKEWKTEVAKFGIAKLLVVTGTVYFVVFQVLSPSVRLLNTSRKAEHRKIFPKIYRIFRKH